MSLNVDSGKRGANHVKPEITADDSSENGDGSQSTKVNAEWLSPAVNEFLKILQIQMTLFDEGKVATKRILFENCSKQLKKHGYFYTYAQCENKWKGLKRHFYNRTYSNRSRVVGKDVMLFKKIEEVLKIEKPYYKDEINEIQQRKEENDYIQNDGQNDVKMILGGQTDEEIIVEYLPPSDEEALLENYQSTDISNVRTLLEDHTKKSNEMFKKLSNSNEQILIFLEALDENEKKKVLLKQRKLTVKQELLQQTKIQNSLLAKLIQKIDNGALGAPNK